MLTLTYKCQTDRLADLAASEARLLAFAASQRELGMICDDPEWDRLQSFTIRIGPAATNAEPETKSEPKKRISRKYSLTREQLLNIAVDPRSNAAVARDFDIHPKYVSRIKNCSAANSIVRDELKDMLANYEFELSNWQLKKDKYIQRMWRLDKTKTKEDHAANFEKLTSLPQKKDYFH